MRRNRGNMKTSAVIVCAGNSTRMGGVNKILLPLGERKVIGVTMQAFQQCESITEIVIVARESDIPAIQEEAEAAGITKLAACTTGGSTRQESVINGIKKYPRRPSSLPYMTVRVRW